MHFSTSIFTTLFLVVPAISAPASLLVQKFAGKKTGSHIVQLNDGITLDSVLARTSVAASHKFELINAFVAQFDPSALENILRLPGVKSVSEDGIMHATITQTDAPWGLARLNSVDKMASQDSHALNFTYAYDENAGAGVDIYIVDTGVRVTHKEFEGRAKWGKTFGGYPDADGLGHGTHCAGTAAGSQFGVAKKAKIIAVKVLGDQGEGSVSDIISGLNFVAEQAKNSGRPSIVSMSLGGSASRPLDDAVRSLIAKDIHVIIAAGNENINAADISPARVSEAVTVGASTIGDVRANFSNFGSVLDIFAPGFNITSAWIYSDEATRIVSGTSMATPHVAGLVAYLIGRDGNLSPKDMSQKLKDMAQKDKLSDLPSVCTELPTPNSNCTVNLLAHIE